MNNFELIFVWVVFSVCAFLLLREAFCWYFKINKRLSLLSDIKDELVQANKYRNEDVNNCRDEDVKNHSSIDAVTVSVALAEFDEADHKAIRKLIKSGPALRM